MIAVVSDRPQLGRFSDALQTIRTRAESCARQLTGWAGSIDKLPFEGRRHLPETVRVSRAVSQKAQDFRLKFLRSLTPDHPLYTTAEARAARGEAEETG